MQCSGCSRGGDLKTPDDQVGGDVREGRLHSRVDERVQTSSPEMQLDAHARCPQVLRVLDSMVDERVELRDGDVYRS